MERLHTAIILMLGCMVVGALVILSVFLLRQQPAKSEVQRVIIRQKGTDNTVGAVIHLRDKHGSGVDFNSFAKKSPILSLIGWG